MESAAGGVVTASLGRQAAAPGLRAGRLFYPGLAVVLFLLVFAGFSRSYYLKAVFGTRELPLLFHVHGAAFTAWMLLLIVQTSLVAAGRTSLHRRLGVFGGVLAALMTVLAWLMAIDLGRRATDDASLGFMIVPIGTVVVFPSLVGLALLWRRFPATHKRLMMIATLDLLSAGIARLPGAGVLGPLGFFGGADLAIVAMLVHDRVTTGRLQQATVWGGLFLIASQVIRVAFGGSAGWLAVARWLAA